MYNLRLSIFLDHSFLTNTLGPHLWQWCFPMWNLFLQKKKKTDWIQIDALLWLVTRYQVAPKISQQTAGRLSFAHCRLSAGLLKAAEAAKKAAVCACVQRTHRSSCAAALQQHQVVVARVENLGCAAESPLVLAAGRPLGWAESQAMAPPPPATRITLAQFSR